MAEAREGINIRIASDGMEAYVSLVPVSEGEDYTKSQIKEALAAAGVCFGVEEEAIDNLLLSQKFDRETLVACGVEPHDGVDGFYQYNFSTEFDNKPTIRVDGTVDYWSIHAVEIVEKDQVIAVYHEPISGNNGTTVKGETITAKRGRPQPPLTGKGFERSQDGKNYIASLTGKIEMNGSRIQILPVYEINGNVDLTTGNIDFRGDVIVHGNVTAGSSIKATGTVTVDGVAEACEITAGKDVILRGGFLGGYKGVIRCKGNVTAKFLEYATIEVEGQLSASSALNCTIVCHDKIAISGKQATIVGGTIYATKGIECQNFGNENEIRTMVSVGVLKEMLVKAMELKNKLHEAETLLNKINEGIKLFDDLATEKNLDLRNDERRVALLRARIAKQAEIAEMRDEIAGLSHLMEHGKDADVRVFQVVYPGVVVAINDVQAPMKDAHKAVRYMLREGKVVMFSLEGELVG